MNGMDEVYGTASDAVMIDGNLWSQSRYVEVPENAIAAVSEGFCPACQGIPLTGSSRNWCPSCKVYWHIRRTGR